MNGPKILWRLNHDRQQGKPFFHPLCLADGTELTALRPADHVWHRALWFSWKFINGLNYWEEDPKTGQSEGQTEILGLEVSPTLTGRPRLNWTSPITRSSKPRCSRKPGC